ncbi:hypothetical protein VTH82DRAFT_5839 [Thermothelomyces myriococcoides]
MDTDMDPTAGDCPDRGPAVFAVTTVTLVMATLFVVARMVTRLCIVRRWAIDDFVMTLAWLFAVTLSLTINVGVNYGLGRHDRNINPAKNPSLMATKTSILILYLRLSKNTQPVLRLGSWATMAVSNIAGFVLTLLNIFQCRPIVAGWSGNHKFANCIPLLTEFICSAPVNVTTDLAILALPIPVLTSMQLPPRQKTILVLTFGLGIFVTVVDVVRIYYLQQAIDQGSTNCSDNPKAIFGQTADFSWNASLSLMWSAVEVNVGIICACIPTLKPLIIRIRPSMLLHPDLPSQPKTNKANTATTGGNASTPEGDRVRSRGLPSRQPPAGSHVLPPKSHGSGVDTPIDDLLSTSHPDSYFPITPGSCRPFPTTVATGEIATATRSLSRNSTQTYYNFVAVSRRGNMLSQADLMENLRYNAITTITFFIWGFSYGLLNSLNNTIAAVNGMSMAQNLSLTAAYFGGGYFFGPALVGGWLLRRDEHHRRTKLRKRRQEEAPAGSDGRGMAEEAEVPIGGFKATFIVGLLVYGLGTIMFWPGAVLGAYGGFLISSFVVGFGLGVIETAANPFLVLCGPPRYGDARLLFAQSVQAVGSVLSGLLADRVFFAARFEQPNGQPDSSALIDVQWTYLAITLAMVFLALFFYYAPIPEVSDAELDELAARSIVEPKRKSIGGISLRTWSLSLAILTQWCYVSAQENTSRFFDQIIMSFVDKRASTFAPTHRRPHPDGLAISLPNYTLVASSAFALSRFLAGWICTFAARYRDRHFLPSARTLLTLSILSTALVSLIIVTLPIESTNPNAAAATLVLLFFCEGPIWPLAFSLGLRGQGSRTKKAATWLTMGASGHAIWPFVSYGIIKAGGSVQLSQVVVVVLMALAGTYPAFLWLVKGARLLGEVADSAPTVGGKKGAIEIGETGRVKDVEASVESSEKEKEGEEENVVDGVGIREMVKLDSATR